MSFKNFVFSALILSLGISFSTHAQDNCIQVLQPAVNEHGVCREFSTPCEVPSSWEKISSCDLVDEKSSLSMDEIQKRRQRLQWKKINQTTQEDENLSSRYPYYINPSSSLIKPRKTMEVLPTERRKNTRTFATPSYKTPDLTTPPKEIKKETTLRPRTLPRSTDMKRSGFLESLRKKTPERTMTTQDWSQKETVRTFWKPLTSNYTPLKLRTSEDLSDHLDNKYQIRWGTERSFGIDEDLENFSD